MIFPSHINNLHVDVSTENSLHETHEDFSAVFHTCCLRCVPKPSNIQGNFICSSRQNLLPMITINFRTAGADTPGGDYWQFLHPHNKF